MQIVETKELSSQSPLELMFGRMDFNCPRRWRESIGPNDNDLKLNAIG